MRLFLQKYCLDPLRAFFAPLIIVKILAVGLVTDAWPPCHAAILAGLAAVSCAARMVSAQGALLWQRLAGKPDAHLKKPEMLSTNALGRGLVCLVLLGGGILNLGGWVDVAYVPMFHIVGWCQHIVWRTVSGFGLASLYLTAMTLTALLALVCPYPNERLRQRLGRQILAQRMVFGIVSLATGGLLAQLLKHLFGRARPNLMEQLGAFHFDMMSLKASLASFPSGHSVTAFSLVYLVFAFTATPVRQQNFWRSSSLLWRVGSLMFAMLICLSRLMLEAHYVSDVLAGAVLGLAVGFVIAQWFGYRRVCFAQVAGRLLPRGNFCVAAALAPLRHVAWL